MKMKAQLASQCVSQEEVQHKRPGTGLWLYIYRKRTRKTVVDH